jgi:hypothetical protein
MGKVLEFKKKGPELTLESGRVSGKSPHYSRDDSDLASRMQRIKTSLDKINLLMTELKKKETPND